MHDLCANKLGYSLHITCVEFTYILRPLQMVDAKIVFTSKKLAHPNCKRITRTTQKSNRGEARKTGLGDLPWRKTLECFLGMSPSGIEGQLRFYRVGKAT